MKIIIAALVVICGCNLFASPIDDLASPSQEIRDAAAKILRATYVPTSRTNWDELLAQVKIGDTMTNVVKLIRKYNPKSTGETGTSSGWTGIEDCRLDDLWNTTM